MQPIRLTFFRPLSLREEGHPLCSQQSGGKGGEGRREFLSPAFCFCPLSALLDSACRRWLCVCVLCHQTVNNILFYIISNLVQSVLVRDRNSPPLQIRQINNKICKNLRVKEAKAQLWIWVEEDRKSTLDKKRRQEIGVCSAVKERAQDGTQSFHSITVHIRNNNNQEDTQRIQLPIR